MQDHSLFLSLPSSPCSRGLSRQLRSAVPATSVPHPSPPPSPPATSVPNLSPPPSPPLWHLEFPAFSPEPMSRLLPNLPAPAVVPFYGPAFKHWSQKQDKSFPSSQLPPDFLAHLGYSPGHRHGLHSLACSCGPPSIAHGRGTH